PESRVEADTDVGARGVVEVERQVGVLRPPAGLLAHGVLLRRRAAHEPDLQPGSVHPGLADRRDGTGTALGARGGLQAHEIARQHAIKANLRTIGHGVLLNGVASRLRAPRWCPGNWR